MSTAIAWERILRDANIDYRTAGKNVGRGEVNIKCPWCGHNDPSHHLGINLATSAYGCWRNSAHRGRSPLRLLTKLVGFGVARSIVSRYGLTVQRHHATESDESLRPGVLAYPAGIYPFSRTFDARFADYLAVARGFANADVDRVVDRFALRVARHGDYAARWIIPYLRGERPLYFTARAITRHASLRYKACPNDCAVVDPRTIVFNEVALENPAGVIVCEGPLDAIKATTYGPLPAVALGSNHATDAQIRELKRARRVVLMLDNDHADDASGSTVSEAALALYAQLISAGIPTICQPIPPPYKDLAEIPYHEYAQVFTTDRLVKTVRQ